MTRALPCLMVAVLAALPYSGVTASDDPGFRTPTAEEISPEVGALNRLLASLEPDLRALAEEAFRKDPEVARLRARAAAAAARAPQARALPDPSAELRLFVLTPETRVGPQRFSVTLGQALPWKGKLPLREQVALHEAARERAMVEARRLGVLIEIRERLCEIAFLRQHESYLRSQRQHLEIHEEFVRGRYATGVGTQGDVIEIQAAITHADQELLAVDIRRRELQSSLNDLLGRSPWEPLPEIELRLTDPETVAALPETLAELSGYRDALVQTALRQRPEVSAAALGETRSETLAALARKEAFPDLRLGLSYTQVGSRDDLPPGAPRPGDDGDDILALTAGIRLPVRRGRIAAAVDEARERQREAQAHTRKLIEEIEREISDALQRLPLLARQVRLLEDVLLPQAQEALRSAESGYGTGLRNALGLLEAEHHLFEVRIAAARVRTDLALARIRLERAVGGPVIFEALSSPSNDTETMQYGEVSP